MDCSQRIFGILRIAMGWLFLWPFLDKLFGLGFSTTPDKAWIAGGSPTAGFLLHGTQGPFAAFFQALSGPFVDWLFMLGLLLIGLSLITGIGVKVGGYSGALLVFLMWLAALPPSSNPFLDEHLIYALVLLAFTQLPVGEWWGLGRWWKKKAKQSWLH